MAIGTEPKPDPGSDAGPYADRAPLTFINYPKPQNFVLTFAAAFLMTRLVLAINIGLPEP